MRRVLALALACSLVVLLGRPVFAAEPLAETTASPVDQAPAIRSFESAHYGLVGTVKFDGVTIDVLGEGDLALPDQQRGSFKFGPVTAEVVMTDDNVYTRTRFDPVWSRQPATEPLSVGPISASELTRLGRDVRLIGTERVGGVETVHYSTAIDFQSVLGPLLPVIDDPEVSEALRSLTGTVDVWVGAEDRLVRQERVVLSIRLPAIEPGGDLLTATVDFTLAYSQLNEPVTISAPPRNDPSPIRTPRPDVVPVTGSPGAAAGAG
ncbi:MAG: hypothetical protein M3O34_02130, partial [Chloroflexota bacterium]|nr:hypothetical protein [Chloroflexota bacterium]